MSGTITDSLPANAAGLTQRHHFDFANEAARKRVEAATAALAARIGASPVDWAARKSRRPELVPEQIAAAEATAIIAEAVLALAAEVDQLRFDVAALTQERS